MNLVNYVLDSSTIALLPADGHRVVRTIPAGSVITLPAGSVIMIDEDLFNENKLVEVLWNGKQTMMFAQDVRARGKKIDGGAG
jgi:hypothetical protein